MDLLHILADFATFVTAVVAFWAYASYRWTRHKRMLAIEKILEQKKAPTDDSLLVSQLAATLKLTGDQVIEAAYYSRKSAGCEGLNRDEQRLKFIQKAIRC
ncbi:MAG: hypothetical protein KGL29_09940 [Alphaproteobacteria bacterium]|nr:hypothetical protein [Alphaproteobacteria bacterium]